MHIREAGTIVNLDERDAALGTKSPDPSHDRQRLPDQAQPFFGAALDLRNLQPFPELADPAAELAPRGVRELRLLGLDGLAGPEGGGDRGAEASPAGGGGRGREGAARGEGGGGGGERSGL